MVEVQLLGPKDLLGPALDLLQRQGVLELRAPPPGDEASPLAPPAPRPAQAAASEAALRRALQLAGELAERLPAAPPRPPAALPGAPAEVAAALEAGGARLDALAVEVAARQAEQAQLETFSALVVALAPLHHGVAPALEPELHGLIMRDDPLARSLLEGEVRALAGGRCEVRSRALGGGRIGVLIVVPRAVGRELAALLFRRGVDEVKLPATLAGRGLVEGLTAVARRQRELPAEIEAARRAHDDQAGALAAALPALRARLLMALDRLGAAARCGATRFAFVASGFMPTEALPVLRAKVAEAFGDRVALVATTPPRTRWAEVPVVLRNRRAVRPFERLLALVPLPRYGSIDPTPWLAIGYPLLFGLVLGDLAFGALGAVVALLVRRRLPPGAGRDVASVALACSAASALFGLLFGEALGGLGEHLGLRPILFDRRVALLPFLGVTVAVGLLHLACGATLGVIGQLRSGHRRAAAARSGQLLMLAGGALVGAALAGLLAGPTLRTGLVVLGIGLLASVLAEGPLAALDLVSGLGNVLSYARLMALGLASAMLAEVANGIGAGLRPLALGIVLAVLLHAANFTLCLVSPAVAALRLHYVEFFERFYTEGGEPYRPFGAAA
jgi:V/A-type H+-transporting ATPase subunit I